MKKNYTEKDMLEVIQQVEAEFSRALAKAEAEVETETEESEENTENTEASFEEEVTGLYASMEKSEAEAHLQALTKVLGVDMKKSEESEESKLMKSELESVKASNEELTKANEELKKNLEQAIAIVKTVVTKAPAVPARKAVTTEAEFVKKSEMESVSKEKDVTKMSKSEVNAALTEKIRSGKLEKKDHDTIVNFYEGRTTIDSIKHLL